MGTRAGWNFGSHVNWEGVIATIESAAERSNSIPLRRWARRFMQKKTCPSCEGTRLKPISLQFKLGGKNIAELGQMDLATLAEWFQSLDERLTDKQRVILKEPLKEVNARLGFLVDVGLDYLALDRSARTLSGGEAQRIRLATQIGSRLTEVLYILDEQASVCTSGTTSASSKACRRCGMQATRSSSSSTMKR